MFTRQVSARQTVKRNNRGPVYSPLACTDDGEVAVLSSRTAFPAGGVSNDDPHQAENEPLLEHCT